jgi:RNA polymerase sigma-70 factor (ECF subfamily)
MHTMKSHTAGTTNCHAWPGIPRYGGDDSDLIVRLRRRDETALREVVVRYASRIYRACYGILRDRDGADEVAKEVFATIYDRCREFDFHGSLYTGLHRVAIAECYEFVLRKRLASPVGGQEDTGVVRTEWNVDRAKADRTIVGTEHLNEMLARVPEEDRWLLISREVEGFSLAELSRITGLNETTIIMRLFRVRRVLIAAVALYRRHSIGEPAAAHRSEGLSGISALGIHYRRD